MLRAASATSPACLQGPQENSCLVLFMWAATRRNMFEQAAKAPGTHHGDHDVADSEDNELPTRASHADAECPSNHAALRVNTQGARLLQDEPFFAND